MRNRFGRWSVAAKYFVVLFWLASFGLLTPSVRACSVLSDPALRVGIVDEEAIIVWDEARKTQHFIRRANFQTHAERQSKARDFGFLVPTPSVPVLAEADDAAFDRVAEWTLPEEIEQERRRYYFSMMLGRRISNTFNAAASKMTVDGTPGSVQVLSQQRVAGYDATVLAANNAEALNRWLKRNGYTTGPQFIAWLQPYIERGWKITAFKISRRDKDATNREGISSGTVRMSFQTPRPFFPYREPSDQRNSAANPQPRSLRVFLLGTQRMNGAIGTTAPTKIWPGEVRFTSRIEAKKVGDLPRQLALQAGQLPSNMWMTVWEDTASPRPGVDDVWFSPAATQEPLVPPPHINYHDVNVYIPLDLALLAMFIALIVWYQRIGENHAQTDET